jgi:hypothetical protein
MRTAPRLIQKKSERRPRGPRRIFLASPGGCGIMAAITE